jgi:hypothetical protein
MTGGGWSRQIPSQGGQRISSERGCPQNPLGGGGREQWGASIALGGGGDGCRSWPESPSNGVGDRSHRGGTQEGEGYE